MATPQTRLDQEAVYEPSMVTKPLTELQLMDDKARIEARFYKLIA